MKNFILKIILGIFVFLLPFMATVGFMRMNAGNSAFIPVRAFTQYFAEYPEDSVEDLKVSFSKVNSVGFASKTPTFEPDFSGNIFNDIKEVVMEGFSFLGTSISAIFDYIVWYFEVVYTVVKLIIDTVVWAFQIIPYMINYSN